MMSLTALLVPTFTQMLAALAGWLDKAQTQFPLAKADDLLAARLAPDMFPLATQVRFACIQAQEAVYRLQELDFPQSLRDLLEEARNAGERPGSIAEARARIDQTLELLRGLAPGALDAAPDKPIAHRLPSGMVFDLTAEQYARDWALGQFYFHLMTAYAILRNASVELGKADFIPHMIAHIRPQSPPGN